MGESVGCEFLVIRGQNVDVNICFSFDLDMILFLKIYLKLIWFVGVMIIKNGGFFDFEFFYLKVIVMPFKIQNGGLSSKTSFDFGI